MPPKSPKYHRAYQAFRTAGTGKCELCGVDIVALAVELDRNREVLWRATPPWGADNELTALMVQYPEHVDAVFAGAAAAREWLLRERIDIVGRTGVRLDTPQAFGLIDDFISDERQVWFVSQALDFKIRCFVCPVPRPPQQKPSEEPAPGAPATPAPTAPSAKDE